MLYEIQPYTEYAAFLYFNATDGFKYTQGKIPGKHLWGDVKKRNETAFVYLLSKGVISLIDQ